MSAAPNPHLMVPEMNPLDLLAEVAVSCSDDEKVEKMTHWFVVIKICSFV